MATGPRLRPRRLSRFVSPLAALVVAAVVVTAGCRKDAPPPPTAPAAPDAAPVLHVDVPALASRVGVKPGGLTYKDVGPGAAVMSSQGDVALRRAGEDRFGDLPAKGGLFAGDVLLTGPHALATLALADDTVVQLAEETAVVVGNRALSADPASSLGLLYGVARLSVSPRARGEGAFLTRAGPVVVGARGTAFVVAVAAGGWVRVGVEHGEVEVAGPAALDKPLALETGDLAVVDPSGAIGKPEAFKADDWGDWRYAIETKTTLDDARRFHANRLVGEESRLDAAYPTFQKLVTAASTAIWQAAAAQGKGVTGKGALEYKATVVERAATIEASYRFAGEVARLTTAAESDALVLSLLYERHPTELAPDLGEFGQEITGAILYEKKLELVSEIFLAPLRAAYYAHTARGRARAADLELPAGAFAAIKVAEVAPAELGKRLPGPVYVAPVVDAATHGHPVWQRAPKLGWDERLTLQPVPPRQGAWYIAPAQTDARLVAGVRPQASVPKAFDAPAPTTPDAAELGFLAPPLPPGDVPATP